MADTTRHGQFSKSAQIGPFLENWPCLVVSAVKRINFLGINHCSTYEKISNGQQTGACIFRRNMSLLKSRRVYFFGCFFLFKKCQPSCAICTFKEQFYNKNQDNILIHIDSFTTIYQSLSSI